jgi:hypothetical protein
MQQYMCSNVVSGLMGSADYILCLCIYCGVGALSQIERAVLEASIV